MWGHGRLRSLTATLAPFGAYVHLAHAYENEFNKVSKIFGLYIELS